jgi:hypothetical protein
LAVIDTSIKQKVIENLIKRYFDKFSPGRASFLFGKLLKVFNFFVQVSNAPIITLID